jgi:hypothetical protein
MSMKVPFDNLILIPDEFFGIGGGSYDRGYLLGRPGAAGFLTLIQVSGACIIRASAVSGRLPSASLGHIDGIAHARPCSRGVRADCE